MKKDEKINVFRGRIINPLSPSEAAEFRDGCLAVGPDGKIIFCGSHKDFNLRTYALTHLRTLLILVGHRPLVAAGDNTFFGGIIKAIGAANIVEGNTPYPTINTEFILAKGPDIIIDLGMGSEETLDLPEIIKKKVVRLDMSDFRAGPRLGNAIEKLALSLRVTK